MNSRCPTIEIFPTSGGSLFSDADGRIVLDVDDTTSVSLEKTLRTEDDVYTIGAVDDILLSVPKSPKNYLYLKKLFDPAVDNPVGVYVESRITVGSHTFIFDRLFAVQKAQLIEIRFTHSESWVTALKNLNLADLLTAGEPGFLGLLDFTQGNIEAKWAAGGIYNDGDDGYWFPMVDYGGWRAAEHHIMVVEDLRPWVHSLYVMRKCFERIGWCLEFPFFETELGRRNIDYILKTDYGDSAFLRNNRRFVALNGISNFFQPGQLINWTETADPGNSFNDNTGEYEGVFQGKFTLRITHQGSTSAPGQTPTTTFTILKYSQVVGGSTASILGEISITPGSSPGDHTLEIETSVLPTDTVVVEARSDEQNVFGDDVSTPMSVVFSNDVKSTFYQNGDVINLGFVIDPGITAWEYLMGQVHICQGIAIEMPVEKIVRILTPFNADIFGEVIEGYFDNTLVSLVNNQPLDTTNSIIRDQLRYITLSFAKSTDEVIKKLAGDDKIDFYSKTVDLGEPLFDSEKIPNPLFEPTVLDIDATMIHLEDVGSGANGYYFPQLVDNDKGEVSYKIKPRKLIAYGYGTQGNGTARIVWEGELQTDIAYAALVSKTISGNEIEFDGAYPDMKLIYGDDFNDLWSMVIGRYIMQFRSRIRLDVLAHLTHKEFFGMSLRNLYEIEYDGHPVAGRILTIGDWRPCEDIASQLIFIPEINSDKYCTPEPPDTTACSNSPSIISMLDGNCWIFSLGGTFDCNIESLLWEIQYESDDPTTWTSLGNGSTVEVCDAGEWFIIRVTVTYDCECPDSIIAKTVYPCESSLNCFLDSVIYEDEFWLGYNYDGDFSDDCIITYTLEIYIDGVLTETLNGPFGPAYLNLILLVEIPGSFSGDRLYVFTIDVTCPDGCPDLSTTCTYQQTTQPGPCNVAPILECVPVDDNGNTCYTWALVGTQVGDPETFVVTWTCLSTGEVGTWFPGDPPVCCSGIIEAHAMVFYCNCPAFCTETVSCEPTGCQIFNPGTAVMMAVCN
jgi:hypothetical protein